MFKNIINFFKKKEKKEAAKANSKDTAKERLHLVLMQDRANVSVDFLDLMRQEIIEVIKKYIDIDEEAMDVRLTNEENEDGTQGAPALYANIPIINIKEKTKKLSEKSKEEDKDKKEDEEKSKPAVEEKTEVKKDENDVKKTDSQENIEAEHKEENKPEEKTKEENKA